MVYAYQKKIWTHLQELCNRYPHRCTGSEGNIRAANYFLDKSRKLGYDTSIQEFDCIDWQAGSVFLSSGNESFSALPSPWSLGTNREAEIVIIDTVEKLKVSEIRDKIVLLYGNIAREQLMPKNFVFYNPEEHQEIIRLLEEKKPLAIISATERNPELAGALYPFPLFEDGDFNIPSVYMTAEEGQKLIEKADKRVYLQFEANRIPTKGFNIIASRGDPSKKKIVISAHIDTKLDTPGALDNASGVVIMLTMMDMLKDSPIQNRIEFLAMNGEDYYAASGEMKYLAENEGILNQIIFNINIDAAGFKGAKTGFTIMGDKTPQQEIYRSILKANPSFREIEPWYQGDHMIFIMNGVPSITITSDNLPYILSEIAHTEHDTIDQIDCLMLEQIAATLSEVVISDNIKK